MLQLMVLYPPPTDPVQFDTDYTNHINLLHEKMGIPANEKPYTITKFLPSPGGAPPYHLLFTMPFESQEALEATMSSAAMQEVGADANRVSSGGAPTILIGNTA